MRRSGGRRKTMTMDPTPTDEARFSFTWGLPILRDMGHVQVHNFMLRTYTRLGLTRLEMLCLIHLASYHYNSPNGESSPARATVAAEMGYGDPSRMSGLIAGLEAKGMLLVERRAGRTSIYDAHPFAQAAYDLWLADEKARAADNAPAAGGAEKRTTTRAEKRTTTRAEKRRGVVRKSAPEEYERRLMEEEEPKNMKSSPQLRHFIEEADPYDYLLDGERI
jgi:hypothetical protein